MEELLSDVKPEHHFITRNGVRVKNLYQLHKTLINMDDDTYNHHVNPEKNDFYNWVRHMYKNRSLESVVLKCKNKNELAQKLKEKLSEAVKKKKEHDVRKIIEEAKKEVEEKKEILNKSKPEIERPQVKVYEQKPEVRKKDPEARKGYPKHEKHVYVDKPPKTNKPRTFTEEEKPANISNSTYMKASVIDFVFGIIIGVIAILIIKQLL